MTPVSGGTQNRVSKLGVRHLISPEIGSTCREGGKAPGVISPPTPAYNSIYRMRGRAPARKLSVSARGRGNNDARQGDEA